MFGQIECDLPLLILNVYSSIAGFCSGQKQTQEDPCKAKSRVVGDESYCDRYFINANYLYFIGLMH